MLTLLPLRVKQARDRSAAKIEAKPNANLASSPSVFVIEGEEARTPSLSKRSCEAKPKVGCAQIEGFASISC
jgi:hypothetical protein